MTKIGELARRPQSAIDAQFGPNYRDYVTHCKRCHHAVLRSQPWEWFTSPLGISHKECPQ